MTKVATSNGSRRSFRDGVITFSQSSPLTCIVLCFILWKTVLFSIALSSPGDGYDTSTTLLFDNLKSQTFSDDAPTVPSLLQRIVHKLTRWDAIYFVAVAERGYLFEQEWAFSFAFAQLVTFVSKAFSNQSSTAEVQALTAIGIANLSHLLSTLILYKILRTVQPAPNHGQRQFTGALLHCVAPAGLFLSAPNSESLYSLFSFSGVLLFCFAYAPTASVNQRRLRDDISIILSGALFGLASAVRSNGVLNVLAYVMAFYQSRRHALVAKNNPYRHVVALALATSLVVAGFSFPQIVAFKRYCLGGSAAGSLRPWCRNIPPSIYTFVQEHYWNNGFLRYWTVSNIPLFLLAAPMLALMLWSAAWYLFGGAGPSSSPSLASLAAPQAALALLALTNFHVQIITRLASGYPLIYIWLTDAAAPGPRRGTILRFMVLYGVVQAGLFSSFLPPA